MNNKQKLLASRVSWLKKLRVATKAKLVQKILAPMGAIRRYLRPPMIDIAKLTAFEKYSQQNLTVNSSLTSQNYHLWLDLLFAGATIQNSGVLRYRLQDIFVRKSLPDPGADLTIISLKYSDYETYNDGCWFFIPEWVSGSISLPLSKQCLSHERVKSDIRKIHTHGFSYDISRDPEVFDEFYKTMYLPYVSKRHGEAAMFDSFAENRKLSEDYDLLLVKKNDNPDQYIAGVMIVYEPQGPRLWSLGVVEGENYVQQGVIGALYHFSFAHLLGKGFDHVRTGGSRAFLNDGVFRFKRKFFQAIIGSNWKGYAVGIHAFTPAVKAFLINNPFILKMHDGLSGVLFYSAEKLLSESAIRQAYKNYSQSGLSFLKIYYFDSPDCEYNFYIPDDLHGLVFIRPANDLLSCS